MSVVKKLSPMVQMSLGFGLCYLVYNYLLVERYENIQEPMDEEEDENIKESTFTRFAGMLGVKTPEALKNKRFKKALKDDFKKYSPNLPRKARKALAQTDKFNKY